MPEEVLIEAEIQSFLALTEPYPTLGTPTTVEVTLHGLDYSASLGLEFWAETPDGQNLSLAKMPVEPLQKGETHRYTAEFTPKQEGVYILHAYLYAGARRIGHERTSLAIAR